jgi:hypothetical protein
MTADDFYKVSEKLRPGPIVFNRTLNNQSKTNMFLFTVTYFGLGIDREEAKKRSH